MHVDKVDETTRIDSASKSPDRLRFQFNSCLDVVRRAQSLRSGNKDRIDRKSEHCHSRTSPQRAQTGKRKLAATDDSLRSVTL